jgi:ketosteroid isomerase-like protein
MGARAGVHSTGGGPREPGPELRTRDRYDHTMGPEDEVRALSAQWDEALVANHPERVASFMTDDWVYVGPDGVSLKSDIIGWITSGRLRHDRMTSVGSEHVVHAGGTIVLTARKTSAGTWEGSPYTADEWITEVYIRTGEGWRCTLSQKTPARCDA